MKKLKDKSNYINFLDAQDVYITSLKKLCMFNNSFEYNQFFVYIIYVYVLKHMSHRKEK